MLFPFPLSQYNGWIDAAVPFRLGCRAWFKGRAGAGRENKILGEPSSFVAGLYFIFLRTSPASVR
jgi:hypothetical protein